MSKYVTVTPAYGRDYKNQKDMRTDWMANKDFVLTHTGQYINRSQALEERFKVIGRYGALRKTMNLEQ